MARIYDPVELSGAAEALLEQARTDAARRRSAAADERVTGHPTSSIDLRSSRPEAGAMARAGRSGGAGQRS